MRHHIIRAIALLALAAPPAWAQPPAASPSIAPAPAARELVGYEGVAFGTKRPAALAALARRYDLVADGANGTVIYQGRPDRDPGVMLQAEFVDDAFAGISLFFPFEQPDRGRIFKFLFSSLPGTYGPPSDVSFLDPKTRKPVPSKPLEALIDDVGALKAIAQVRWDFKDGNLVSLTAIPLPDGNLAVVMKSQAGNAR